MKRMIAIVLVILTMTAALAGCSGTGNNTGMTSGTSNDQTPNSAVTTPGGSSAANDNGGASVPETGTGTADAYGDGAPSDNENGIIDENQPTAKDDSPVKEFGDDMQDIVDDAGNAVEDAVDGRSRRNGTGMTGGR